MSSSEELRNERIKHRDMLIEHGMDPYPTKTSRTHELKDAIQFFDSLAETNELITVAGRIMSIRGHGGSAFVDLYDGTERMQVFLSKEKVGEESFELFEHAVDAGDFVEVNGTVFLTKRDVKTVDMRGWKMLSKSLDAVPSEWFGLKDEDARYRKRYLDMLLNGDVRDIVYKRAKFWSAVRRFHEEHGFLEVQTPVLEVTTGGGDARPFLTHQHALDLDVYLRISAGELWQKRLMVAGFPKTFEIGRVFRNEGMSAEHLQDYEQCEAYWAYADYEAMYHFLQDCYKYVAKETFGTLKFKRSTEEILKEGDRESWDE